MPPHPFSHARIHDYHKSHGNRNAVDVLVVGSGVGGLTAASMCAQLGKTVVVLERSATAGGATHAFTESGFKFEMGLQDVGAQVWLGAKSPEPQARVLDAAAGGMVEWTQSLPLSHVAYVGETRFDVKPTWAEIRADLVARFPDEARAIDEYQRDVVQTRDMAVGWMFSRLPAEASGAPSRTSAVLSKIRRMAGSTTDKHKDPHGQWGAAEFRRRARMTVEARLTQLTSNAQLRYLLTYAWGKYGLPPQAASWAAHCLVAGQFLEGAAFPKGGAGSIEKAMVEMIERHGGVVFTDAVVQSLLIEKGQCVGVCMADGLTVRARNVISAVGAINTYECLVPRPFAALVQAPFEGLKELRWSSFAVLQVFLGFSGTSQELGLSTAGHWFLPEGEDHSGNSVVYFLDTTFSTPFPYVHVSFPSAKDPTATSSTAVVFCAAHYDWFKGMGDDDVEKIKDEIVARVTAHLFDKFPQLKDKVQFVELATPLTHEFQLGAVRGGPFGLGHTPSRFLQADSWLRPQSPIKNLFLAGQDMFTCTVPGASMGGFMAAAACFPGAVSAKFGGLFGA